MQKLFCSCNNPVIVCCSFSCSTLSIFSPIQTWHMTKSEISKSFVNMEILFPCCWVPGTRQELPTDWFSPRGPHCMSLVTCQCDNHSQRDRVPAAASACITSAHSSLLHEMVFLIYKTILVLIKCLFHPYCCIIICNYWKLRLFGCL